ncbi:unnamed protein product [Gongylonema pulchrum]|nr:unnamed protein product [Gongylonema pulchrum]
MYEFVTDLSQRSFRALLELLLESGLIKRLPEACSIWERNSASRWHSERGSAQRRDISVNGCSQSCRIEFLISAALMIQYLVFGV